MTSTYQWIEYETIDGGVIAVITLNRPRQRNAQSRGLLVELDHAFEKAAADDDVRVIVLRGAGTSFSAGHDLGSAQQRLEKDPGPGQHPTYRSWGGTKAGIERMWGQEHEFYLTRTKRWRDLQKITIASVQGPVYAAGLMLMWSCDLIVADETATFADVVGTRLGMCGVEYFAHPWELGFRRTKDLLLTGDALTSDEAFRIGMVSRVFASSDLAESTLAYARRIAELPAFTSAMIKNQVNQAQDAQGFPQALQAAFTLHELNHAQWLILSSGAATVQTPEFGGRPLDQQLPIVPTAKNVVRSAPVVGR
ncbi:enoyl-CoA hydratase [Nocardia sp. NPDC005745]|uniref:enoyl-CoA hydratase n=1 Tax=Nocardia sp. NPDC005745 TaxID=3157061 RepID=UPI00340CE986